MDLTRLLRLSIKEQASDLHLSAGLPPILRVDGDMIRTDLPVLLPNQVESLVHEVLNDTQIKALKDGIEIDFSFEIPEMARFRANVFNQNRGKSAVFRSIPSKIATLEELGLGDIFKQLALLPRGLVLITGPTGSGKSSTQAAMVDYINKKRSYHILTIEDPIEFVHHSEKSLINQREVRRDTQSFSQALRSMVSDSLQAAVTQTLMKKVGGGRIAAHEIMIGTPAVRNLVREDKNAQIYSVIQTSSSLQMQTLDQCLNALVEEGLVTLEAAREKAVSPPKI